jgi:hypothetical protein
MNKIQGAYMIKFCIRVALAVVIREVVKFGVKKGIHKIEQLREENMFNKQTDIEVKNVNNPI